MNKVLFEKLKNRKDELYCIDHILEERVMTSDLNSESIYIANHLWKKGVKKGDKVAIILNQEYGYHILSLYFANIWIGAISVPISPAYSGEEKEFVLGKCDPKVIITTEDIIDKLSAEYAGVTEFIDIKQLLAGIKKEMTDELLFSMPSLEGDDVLAILFTAGTTGHAKGVCMSVNTLVVNLKKNGERFGYDSKTRMMLMSPLVHASTITHAIILPALFGFSVVLNEIFNLKLCSKFWDIVEKDEVTVVLSVPSMLASILLFKNYFHHNLEHFKYFMCGSAVLLESLQKEFEQTFKVRVNEFYASTETGIIATTLPDETISNRWKPLEGTSVKISDDGEILVSSNYLFKGYIKDEEETQKSLFRDDNENIWYRTGDVGVIDDQGFLKITDRKKDIIIKGGFNISPKQVDSIIIKHPNVSEVATVGVPSEIYGEEVVVAVQVREENQNSENELLQYCRDNMNSMICPSKVIIFPQLPKTNMGKIDKKKIQSIITCKREEAYGKS